jgi:hypothetical protein
MRIRSSAQLKNLAIQERHKKAIEAALAEQPSCRDVAMRHRLPTRERPTPQQHLTELLQLHMPGYPWVPDYVGAVPGRRYELDIALVNDRIGIEVDGFTHHGKNLKNFHRDRDKDYLLALAGWIVLRLSAGLICKSPSEAIDRVEAFLSVSVPRQRALYEVGLLP